MPKSLRRRGQSSNRGLLDGRCQPADRGFELCIVIRSSGERADYRQVNFRLPVCLGLSEPVSE
jgi:hypothetical protein